MAKKKTRKKTPNSKNIYVVFDDTLECFLATHNKNEAEVRAREVAVNGMVPVYVGIVNIVYGVDPQKPTITRYK